MVKQDGIPDKQQAGKGEPPPRLDVHFGELGADSMDDLQQCLDTIDWDRPGAVLTPRQQLAMSVQSNLITAKLTHPATAFLSDGDRAEYVVTLLADYLDMDGKSAVYHILLQMLDFNVVCSISEGRMVLCDRWQASWFAFLVDHFKPVTRQALSWNVGARRRLADLLANFLWIQLPSGSMYKAKPLSISSELNKLCCANPRKPTPLPDKLRALSEK